MCKICMHLFNILLPSMYTKHLQIYLFIKFQLHISFCKNKNKENTDLFSRNITETQIFCNQKYPCHKSEILTLIRTTYFEIFYQPNLLRIIYNIIYICIRHIYFHNISGFLETSHSDFITLLYLFYNHVQSRLISKLKT